MPTTGGSHQLDLQSFFPYRLALLAEAVSAAVSQIYARRFDLTRPEWRILAVLGSSGSTTAKDVGQLTTLDKMQVSRALQRMERRSLIVRNKDEGDRRNRIVELTSAGRALYDRIVPLALAREKAILSGLEREQMAALDKIISELLARSRTLREQG
ncbi:MAG: MarR family transcriptional regulator [Hyphomicrobiaceae bacterium]|nr:MAG: MarR family transcriptional regulator [Hyphomicrobiaceae bacterium]